MIGGSSRQTLPFAVAKNPPENHPVTGCNSRLPNFRVIGCSYQGGGLYGFQCARNVATRPGLLGRRWLREWKASIASAASHGNAAERAAAVFYRRRGFC